ncbi:MAG: terminase family protein [Verrucomicrobiota bacterium]|nr:terminase family protein [Verrucomicrobiota bacterium]
MSHEKYFMPYQQRWIKDETALKIVEKSRQIGFSFATAYSAVRRVAVKGARLDVWVSSRDDTQAKLFLDDCKNWAKILNLAALDLGEVVIDRDKDFTAYVLEFATGLRIYSLSSNPNALAGKRGHVILDEFALHKDQRLLYRIAKPVTTWGGQLEIISTHRGMGTVFNEIIREITEKGNPMGWSHHKVTLADAVAEGLVARINEKTGRKESNEAYLARIRAECLDEEQWAQEYCCVPSDESAAFISHEMIRPCVARDTLKNFEYIKTSKGSFYLGMDVARKQHLCVIDVGEKIGDVIWDRVRVELSKKTFSEIRAELYRFLELPQIKRACLDATGLGMQLAEEAKQRFGYKVEEVTFTATVKEELAFPLRAAFEDLRLRVADDHALHADLRGVKKEVTGSGNIRFVGESDDSHCDRFWAMALRQHAVGKTASVGAMVVTE